MGREGKFQSLFETNARFLYHDSTTVSKIPFPIKLYRMLEHIDLHNVSFQKYVSWQPHGRAFRIHDIKGFKTHVQPLFFGNAQYNSFRRQLNLWGFKRLTHSGPDQGSYYHQMFLRTKPMLCHNISRTAVLGVGQGRLVPNPSAEPNFYSMDALPESSEATESKYIASFGALRNKKQMRQGGKRKNETREVSYSSFQNIKMPRLIQCSGENLPRREDHHSRGKNSEKDLKLSFQKASRRLNVLASEYSLRRHTITRPTHDRKIESEALERITPAVSSLRRSSFGKSYDVRVVSNHSIDTTTTNSGYITKEICNNSSSNMFLNSSNPSFRIPQTSENQSENAPAQQHSYQKDSAHQDPYTKYETNMTRTVSSNKQHMHAIDLEDSCSMIDEFALSADEQREWNSFFNTNPASRNTSWDSHISKYFPDVARYSSDDDKELERIIARSEEQSLTDIEPYTGIPPPLSREEKEQFKSLSTFL